MSVIYRFVTILLLLFILGACTTSSQQLREESKEAYPHGEWRRPPSHWSPP
jgi:hypothetical protein